MDYVLTTLVGLIGGAICVLVAFEKKRKQLQEQKRTQDDYRSQIDHSLNSIRTQEEELARVKSRLDSARTEFDSQAVSYKELQDENSLLKRDLRNIDVHLRKLQLDHDQQAQAQLVVNDRVNVLGTRYLRDNVKWISALLNPNNFTSCKQRLLDAIESCRGIGLIISSEQEASLVADLKTQYEGVVRAAIEREEQARIKAQIREEQARERDIERELQRLDSEREAIKVALEKALSEAADQHSEEVERLRARLAEAEARSQRALSQAQLTKSGHVYVISNIGSFGEGVFKVGMTRRLDPMDRVNELGDASVPFPFDVHMMISVDDAPSLENALHRKLHRARINKTNPRKEFFKTDIETIVRTVKEHHGEVQYMIDPEALQFRQSVAMPADDQEYIESVYDDLDETVGNVMVEE